MIPFLRFARLAAPFAIAAAAVAAAPAGPQAFFGFVTHYETSAAGRGEVQVFQLVPGGPAERAGIQPRDLIVAFNGVGFRFADEYEYMRSLGAFESGRELKLTLERGGRKVEATIVPEPLSPQQRAGLADYLAKLERCVATGVDCPCPGRHGQEPDEDFGSPYHKLGGAIFRAGGKTVLTISRDSAGVLSYRSAPVPLPADFEIGPEDDGLLWQRIEALGKGKTLEVEITMVDPERRRTSILTAPPGQKVQ